MLKEFYFNNIAVIPVLFAFYIICLAGASDGGAPFGEIILKLFIGCALFVAGLTPYMITINRKAVRRSR